MMSFSSASQLCPLLQLSWNPVGSAQRIVPVEAAGRLIWFLVDGEEFVWMTKLRKSLPDKGNGICREVGTWHSWFLITL